MGTTIETRNDPGNYYPGGTVVPLRPQSQRNYGDLDGKPRLNGVELVGDKSVAEIIGADGIAAPKASTNSLKQFCDAILKALKGE